MRLAALIGGLTVVIGTSAAVLHPMAALAIVLGTALAVWVFSSALNATLAFIMVLVLRPGDLFPAFGALYPAKLVALIAVFLWLVTKLLRGDAKISRAPHGKWMLALFFGVLLSALMSSNRAASMALFTDVFVKLLMMYGLLVHVVDTKSRAVKLHLTLAVCTVVLALHALYSKSAGLATIEGNRAGFVGLLGDPNDLALVLLMYVPLFAELAIGSRGMRRFLWLMPLLILASGILATVSRGGALGLLVALAATLYDRGRLSTRLVLVPALAVTVFGLILLAGVNERSSGAINQGELDSSAQGRLDAWGAGVRMAMHNPIFGVGLDQFADSYESYVRDPVHWGPTDAHNSFLKVAAETGIGGFVPFMALVVLSFRSAYRRRKVEFVGDEPKQRAVRRSLLPAMTGFCVAAFFLSQPWSWFFFILFAQSAVLDDLWKPEHQESDRSVLAQVGRERNKSALYSA